MVEGACDLNTASWSSSIASVLTRHIVEQTSRSGYLMYPYLISVYGLGAGKWNIELKQRCRQLTHSITATTYAMCRMVFVSLPSIPSRSLRLEPSDPAIGNS